MSGASPVDRERYDVLVAGGGPAGATAATLLARAGHDVLLVERAVAPRFKVGESLMPATYHTFERLGVLERMRESHFPRKGSVQFFGPDGQGSQPFYFQEFAPHESSITWQVVRSEFDQMLLENAAERGAEVRRGVSVRQVLFEDDRAVGARLRAGRNGEVTVAGRVFVDATGQSALLGRRLGLQEVEPLLRQASFFTHYEGAHRDSGVDGGATLIFHARADRCWFWFIPLPDDRVSVGLVGPVDHLVRNREGGPEEVFEEELAGCPALGKRLAGARRVREIGAIRDFSYRCRRVAGDGWVLVGDAFGFIDPIYSTGVFLALKSGEMAADSIHRSLAASDLSAASLGAFAGELRHGVEGLRKLVYAFYDREFSFSRFLAAHPDRREDLVNMLMGNIFDRPMDRLTGALDEHAGEIRRREMAEAGS